MAMDLLAAPATTASAERIFSESDDVINDERPRLSEESAAERMSLRSWITSGLVELTEVSI